MDELHTVVAFEIPLIDNIKCTNVRNFHIKQLEEKKTYVEKAKGKYDEPYEKNQKTFIYVTNMFKPSYLFRNEIQKKYKTPHVTNAWLKAYELFDHYKFFPAESDNFLYFDNAAFPGTFILAAIHYINTLCNIKNFQWYGSSLLSDKETKGEINPLEDTYKLYKNYPNNWLMNKLNNGDVTSINNQKLFAEALGDKVDFYSSDLGFGIGDQYNDQEKLHAHANLGQIITGLLTLKNGGNMVTKQYSYFEPFTISLMGIFSRLFKRTEICKPMFSEASNSETYLVGLNYIKNIEIIQLLLERLNNWNLNPIITKNCLGNSFLNSIIKSQSYFSDVQANILNEKISEYNRFIKLGNMSRKYILKNNKFNTKYATDLEKWLRVHKLIPLPYYKKLKM